MKTVAIGAIIFWMLLAFIAVLSSGGIKPTTILFSWSKAVEIAAWLYLSAILIQFYRRTQLREYLLSTHTFWLAGVIAYPVSYIFSGIVQLFANTLPANVYNALLYSVGGLWLVLVLVGKELSRRRASELDAEIQNNPTIWKNLSDMSFRSILFFQFPKHS